LTVQTIVVTSLFYFHASHFTGYEEKLHIIGSATTILMDFQDCTLYLSVVEINYTEVIYMYIRVIGKVPQIGDEIAHWGFNMG
jgi:hypothetical protein